MKKSFFGTILFFASLTSFSQGVSFSYLIPKNGYLSAPVSPFSFRGLGIGSHVGAETGITLYNVPGLAMDQLPFEYDKPLTGPHFAVLIPGQAFVRLPLGKSNLKFMGGGFAWWNVNTRINEGNMDRAFREYLGWEVLNSNFELDDKPGYGWMAGVEFKFPFNDKFSIVAGAQYLKGAARSTLSGSYAGVNAAGNVETGTVDLPDAEITVQGIEISLGAVFQ